MNLEQEAEEYARNKADESYIDDGGDKIYTNYSLTKALIDFTINSKYVQIEKIKAQIEILTLHIEHPTKPGYKRNDVLNKIKELQQQLNEIEQ